MVEFFEILFHVTKSWYKCIVLKNICSIQTEMHKNRISRISL